VPINQENAQQRPCYGIEKLTGCSETAKPLKNIEDTMSSSNNGSTFNMAKRRKSRRNMPENSSFKRVIEVKIPIC
jgi:hypothetical protein